MAERFIRTLVLFIVLTIVFGALERIFPSIPHQAKWRKGVWLDTFYWFFTPMVIQIMSIISIALVLLPLHLGDFQKTKYPCRMGKAKRAHLKSLGEMGTLGFAHPTANL